MRLLVVAAALVLAGCAGPESGEDPCRGRSPLQVKPYRDPAGPADSTRFEVSLWNCRDDRALRVASPCGPHAALAPRLDADGTRYVIAWNGSAVPEADAACEEGHPPFLTVEPRHSLVQHGYAWNGTLRQPDGTLARSAGSHEVFVEAGGYFARATVEVPR